MVVRSKTCDNGDYLVFMEMPFDVSQQQAKLMVTVMLRMHNYHYREQHEDALGTICEQEMANVVASYHVVETTVAKILKEEWQQQYDIDAGTSVQIGLPSKGNGRIVRVGGRSGSASATDAKQGPVFA